MDKIQCGIPVGPRNNLYLDYMLSSIEKTKTMNIEFVIFIDSLVEDIKSIEIICNKYNFVKIAPQFESPISTKPRNAGFRHAYALNHILDYLNTDIIGFFDVDLAFLLKGWDKIMINQINDINVAYGSEPTNENSWRKYPNAMAMMINKNAIKKLNIDFDKHDYLNKNEPIETIITLVKITKENQHIWNKEIGTEVYLEVGWKLPYYIGQSDYTASVMNSKKITSPYDYEFYYYNDLPMIGHLTKSRVRGITSKSGTWWVKETKKLALSNGITL